MFFLNIYSSLHLDTLYYITDSPLTVIILYLIIMVCVNLLKVHFSFVFICMLIFVIDLNLMFNINYSVKTYDTTSTLVVR